MAPKKQQEHHGEYKEEPIEFGGPLGCCAVMLVSHMILYYFWYCLEFNDSRLVLFPSITKIIEHAKPTWTGFSIYMGFILFEAILAVCLPGLKMKGLPLPHEGGLQLEYNCNAIQSWYITLASVGVLHTTNIMPLTCLMDHYAAILTSAVIFSNAVSVFIYLLTMAMKKGHRLSGNVVYDFFMGVVLNPRIGPLDLKMFAEARVSWILLFLLTLSAAAKQYELLGYISSSMVFMVLAHGLYTNAIMKGEECILTTWDIFYEKWGWMLIFWNLAGVPFVYCYQSVYILKKGEELKLPPFPYVFLLFLVLLIAYYVWDTSQSQRNRFRAMQNGTFADRKTFPQLPWGTLKKDAAYLNTRAGSKLLIDGWWAYARKIHYTADVVMALTWGLICGFDSFVPYFYFVFFTGMILHRAHRDNERCRRKYKEDWDIYCKKVPFQFIPYIY